MCLSVGAASFSRMLKKASSFVWAPIAPTMQWVKREKAQRTIHPLQVCRATGPRYASPFRSLRPRRSTFLNILEVGQLKRKAAGPGVSQHAI